MDYDDYDFDDQIDGSGDDQEEQAGELTSEASYICNSCGEEIVVPLDYSEGQSQQYVEDCPVCCNPNVIYVHFEEDGDVQISSRSEHDYS